MKMLFLIGMPGAGKSHWGHIWGKQYGYQVADLDEDIEAKAGIPIADIFRDIGEAGFRTMESAVLLETIAALKHLDSIIVTGGGTATFNKNIEIMLRAGCVVYLRADISFLLSNILKGKNNRPLLQHGNRSMLDEMLAARKPFYEKAHVIVDVEHASTNTFAEILKECISLPS